MPQIAFSIVLLKHKRNLKGSVDTVNFTVKLSSSNRGRCGQFYILLDPPHERADSNVKLRSGKRRQGSHPAKRPPYQRASCVI